MRPPKRIARPEQPAAPRRPGEVALRVLGSSSGMVGACATLVGLVKLMEPRVGESSVDKFAGLTAIAFVISACLANIAIRLERRPALQARLEFAADMIFLAAMLALGGIGVMFAFDVI